MAEKILIHHIPRTRSERILWLAEELGLAYEVREVRYPDGLRAPDFLDVNPIGAVPAIEDGRLRIRESSAIVTYLLARYGGKSLSRDVGDESYADYLMWLYSAEATFFRPLARYWLHSAILPEAARIPGTAAEAKGEWDRYLPFINRSLADRSFLVDDRFSAADILIGHVLRIARHIDCLPAEAACAHAYLDRMAARPAYRRAIGSD